MTAARSFLSAITVTVGLTAMLFAVPVLGTQAPEQSASTPSQAPVFRGGVNFVSVDVYPRRDGKVVHGLTLGDFQVFEDGRPQKVETFEFLRFDALPSDEDRRDPSSQAEAERLARDPHNRVFVVFLDMAHTTVPGSHHARQPVVDFLRRTIGARDLFGYMTAEISASNVTFGRRTETIESELAEYWTWGLDGRLGSPTPRTDAERRLIQCAYQTGNGGMDDFLLNLSREEALQVSLENIIARLRDLRDERKNILFISEGWTPRGPQDRLNNFSASKGEVPKIGVGPGGRIGIGGNMQGREQDDTECSVWIRRLISIDFEKRFRELLTSARNANVSFYPVDVGGLRTGVAAAEQGPASSAADRLRSLGSRRDTLMTLADNTDGFAVVDSNDLVAGVRKISDDLSAFYLLGYYSTNASVDSRFRRIEVKIAKPGVDVSARRGYFPLAAGVGSAATAPAVRSPAETAMARLSTLRDSTELSAYGVVAGTELYVVAEVAAAFAQKPGWQNGVNLEVRVSRGDGTTLNAPGTIVAGERSSAISIPIEIAAAGPWQISVQASGPDGILEARTEIAAQTGVLLGDATAWRGTQSPRVPLKPVADFRLARTDRLRVEWPELEPTDTRRARLLDRRGSPLGSELPFVTVPSERRALAIELPIAALPEGEFVIELTASKGATTERRLMAFRVVR